MDMEMERWDTFTTELDDKEQTPLTFLVRKQQV